MVYLFSTFSDFRSLAAKDMKLKMSCGRKKIHVENAPWWKSLEVEKVAAKSVSGWKTPCGQTCHCSINTLPWGGGKWFILYQPKIYYSIWTMIYLFFNFFIFQELGSEGIEAENVLWQKKIHVENVPWWKCLEVEKVAAKSVSGLENSLWPNMSLFKKYLVVENTSRWQIFGGPKSCN